MLNRRAVVDGVGGVVHVLRHQCLQRGARASAQAKRSAQQSVQRRVILRIARVAWHGIVQLIVAREGGGRRTRCAAGVQLYFPREDDDGMLLFVSRASPLSLDRHGLTLPC